MPILTISELVLSELSQMHFKFGGTPADVVEYEDGGRKASGQAISVEGLEAVNDKWVVQDPSVVPIADANGMIPEFYGPKGIIALRVDFGFGPVILRTDASSLHKELRDLLLARLSELQVDNDSFRQAVSGELDAMRARIDTAVDDALAEVAELIEQQQAEVIQQAVDAKLATDLAPTLDAAIDDAMEFRVPPLIDAKVPPVVQAAVSAEVVDLQAGIDLAHERIDTESNLISNTRYELDSVRHRTGRLENQVSSLETTVTISTWNRTVTFDDCVAELRLMKFQNIVVGHLNLRARRSNGGSTGFTNRSGMGIPSSFLPKRDNEADVPAAAMLANNTYVDPGNYRVGITDAGNIYSQGYTAWHTLHGTLLYFT